MADIPKVERLALLRATLAILCLARERAGGDIDLAMLMAAVRLGELEGKPFDVSALSAVTGIPRRTVQRKLDADMIEWRLDGRRKIPTLTEVPIDGAQGLATLRAIIRNACAVLP